MHFCVAMVTKEFPDDKVIEKMLEKNNIPHDYFQVGGRYCAKLKLEVDKDDKHYDWCYYAKDRRSGRLFRSGIMETKIKDFEEDYFPYFGFDCGYMLVDGCRIEDCLNLDEAMTNSYMFLSEDNDMVCRDVLKKNEYNAAVRKIIKTDQDCTFGYGIDGYACIVDVHD